MGDLQADVALSAGENPQLQYINEVLRDYELCCLSRAMSELCRKEVLNGKAKFGIGGSGKEVAQIALSKAFKKGDFRAGYYRDQTILLALDLMAPEDYFAQLYADVDHDPFSGGRQMVSHFATPFCDKNGEWLDLNERYNMTSDVSSTAGQVARAVGLAFATKKFDEVEELANHPLNCQGKSVTFLSIGDGSTSEGCFLEAINAAAVMQIPLAISVWDDGFAISVPKKEQTVKESISKALEGFLRDDENKGIRIYTAKGWDYPGLCEMYLNGIPKVRDQHVPALFHVYDMTQPLGHSTSGSHTRYKDESRMDFEKDYDCNLKMREWILETQLASEDQLLEIETGAKQRAREGKNIAWKRYKEKLKAQKETLLALLRLSYQNHGLDEIKALYEEVKDETMTSLSDVISATHRTYFQLAGKYQLTGWKEWLKEHEDYLHNLYHSNVYSQTQYAALEVEEVAPAYTEEAQIQSGFEILNKNFEALFRKYPELFAFGEDVGVLGDVNQGMVGLQAKFGAERIFDTGIREWTIIGQALGMSMRGLRPIAEVQYLDYVYYTLAPLTDDVATLRYRTNGLQRCPMIIRTRGHRLEGIWHSGSPMAALLHSLRGMYVCVPRNMVQAAGMYNTLIQSDDPALIVECLNAYRKKENCPSNLADFTVPLGHVEIINEGMDITLVTYGACVEIALEASRILEGINISVEVIDAQTLLPFDLDHTCARSVKKTNKLLVVDEDMPGATSAYLMQQIIEEQGAFDYLEIPTRTISAREHRPPYGDNGNYVTKPNRDQIVQICVEMMSQVYPSRFDFLK